MKWYLMWDAMTRGRTDGALLRISTPVVDSEAAARQSGLRHRQAEINLRDMEAAAAQAVRSAARAVATQAQRIDTTAKAVTLEEASLAAEEEKFRVGISTSHDVLEVQDDLTTARQGHLEAQTSYLSALSRLHYEEGTLLDRYRIEIQAEPQ